MAGKQMTKTQKRTTASLAVLAFTILVYIIMRALIVSGVLNPYITGIINLMLVNIVAAVSLNLVTGVLGQLVLGHAAFMLVGAYASAIFIKSVPDWPLESSLSVGLLLAGVLAGAVGLFIGIPALRLRGDYLAIITLGFGKIIEVLARSKYFEKYTNGALGFRGYKTFASNEQPAGLFTFAFIVAVFVIFFSYTYGTSRHGRSVISIREDEIAAESSGINTTYYKLLTFTLSAFFAGMAGALMAQKVPIIDPSKFDFNFSVEILMMVVLGGMGSITGSVLSAGALTALPEFLRSFANWRMLIYSALLVIIMLFRPKGLLGRKEIQVIAPFEKLMAKIKGSKKEKPKPKEGNSK